jgi:hypothetical protein
MFGENINMDQYKNTTSLQNGPKIFTHPALVGVFGRSGCGKTSMLLGLLMGDNEETRVRFTRLYVIAGDLNEPCYEMLRDKMLAIQTFINDELEASGQVGDLQIYFEYDHPNKFDIDELDVKERNVVIFDDCIVMLEDKASRMRMQSSYMRGRKKNASIIFLSQNPYHPHLKFIRNQCRYIYLFNTGSNGNIKRLASEIGVDERELTYKCGEALRDPHGFVAISGDSKKITIGFG